MDYLIQNWTRSPKTTRKTLGFHNVHSGRINRHQTTYQQRPKGQLHVKGIGKNILTALLHTLHPDRYGVWNNRTKQTLEILRRSPSPGHDLGSTYLTVNEKLLQLSKELDTDLTTIDGLMWYVSKRVSTKLTR